MLMLKLFSLTSCIFISTMFSAQVDWQLFKTDALYSIWLKDVPKTKIKQFKLKTTLKEDISTLYNVMKDVEKMNLWYDKVKSVKLLNKISENEAIYLLEYDLPFPFEDRISTIKGIIDYDLKAGIIKVSTSYYPYTIPKDKNHLLTIKKIASSWEIQKLSNGNVNITHTGYLDPGGNIPIWLINEGVSSGPLKTLEGLRKYIATY